MAGKLRADELGCMSPARKAPMQPLPGPFGEAKRAGARPDRRPAEPAGHHHLPRRRGRGGCAAGVLHPNSQLKALRREAIEALTEAREAIRPRGGRKPVSVPPPVYPESHLSFLYNVYNEKARTFYHRYGVQLIDAAYEAHEETGEVPVMIASTACATPSICARSRPRASPACARRSRRCSWCTVTRC